MICTDDLQAAFEAAGVESFTIARRSPKWGSKWVVHANFHGHKQGVASPPHRDLDVCVRTVLKHAPRNPTPSAALDIDLEDLF